MVQKKCMFVLPAFVPGKSREHSVMANRRTPYKSVCGGRTDLYGVFLRNGGFLFTGCEKVISEDEAGDNNTEGEQPVFYKQHNAHPDSNPEKNKAD